MLGSFAMEDLWVAGSFPVYVPNAGMLTAKLRPHPAFLLRLWVSSRDKRFPETELIKNAVNMSRQVSTQSNPSFVELRKEVVMLEAEIMRLERHLLSLYRAVFEEQTSALPRSFEKTSKSETILPSLKTENENEVHQGSEPRVKRNSQLCNNQISFGIEGCTSSFKNTSMGRAKDGKNASSGHFTLADHLSLLCLDSNLITAEGLSEDIVSWSSFWTEENPASHEIQGSREENGSYGDDILEVTKICLDDDSFKFSIALLQKFRSLVRKLEEVDLTYSIGGHCINAYMIQNAILGIQSRHSSLTLSTLFSPSRKPHIGNVGHAYTLEYPEPLVHFALCSGAYSDPPCYQSSHAYILLLLVRVYTAKTIFLDLKAAKEDFIKANVYINKEMKIILPRILYYFAKDMALGIPRLMDTSIFFAVRPLSSAVPPVRLRALFTDPCTATDGHNSMAASSGPKCAQKSIILPPQRRGCHLVTSKIMKEIGPELSEFKCGLAHLFRTQLIFSFNYTSALTFLNNIVPEGRSAPWKHTLEDHRGERAGLDTMLISDHRGERAGLDTEEHRLMQISPKKGITITKVTLLLCPGLGAGCVGERSTTRAELLSNPLKQPLRSICKRVAQMGH
ncbi:hypothetical protein SAY87_002910 [Trapa incisa]|uniref:DUF547 domain-containing protein n=1 Tax=Trapa incisa TaxID=236973 RepID=A0AAN7KI77_9MYRT|nr:hypothetical protein SAY87_002910 [Trapa incisa]